MEPAADLAAQLNHLAGREEYLLAASTFLAELFPSNGVSRVSLDTRSRASEIRSFPQAHPFGGQADKLIDVYADHPLRVYLLHAPARGVHPPTRLSDTASDLALYRTRAFNDGLRTHEANRELSILCSSAGGAGYAGWGITRWRVDFTDNELELAARVQPVLRLLDAAYGEAGAEPGPAPSSAEFALTPRELEILQLLGRGLTGVAIGHLLGISARTVAKHLEHAYAKLGVTNRIDALRQLRGG